MAVHDDDFRMFTEAQVREIVAEEVKKHLRVSGWAALESNGCGYSHVNGGAFASWDGEVLGRESAPRNKNSSPVQTV